MKAGSFEWHPARSADEAVALLAEYAPQDGRVIAGGQSLVPSMALRLAFPSHLIDINGVEEFSRVRVEGTDLVIGACVRHSAFHAPVEPGPLGRLLTQVVHNIAHYPIRQRGTFCGSLANADPASEWCLVAATLGARMVARSVRGERVIEASEWFQGIMTSGTMRDIRIGTGSVEVHPRRIAVAEALLEGRAASPEAIAAAAAAVSADVDPLEDIHTSADYRRDLVGTAVRRAHAQAGD